MPSLATAPEVDSVSAIDILESVAQLLDAVAWPLVILAGFLIFRKPIAERIRRLRTLKGKNWAAEFEQEIATLQYEASQQLAQPVAAAPATLPDAWELVSIYPRGAVVEAWLGVESELIAATRRINIDIPSASPFRVVQELVRHEHLSPAIAELISELRRLRNEAVHATEFELSERAAKNYIATAQMVSYALSQLG